MVYRSSTPAKQKVASQYGPTTLLGRSTQDTISALLGIRPAHAAEPQMTTTAQFPAGPPQGKLAPSGGSAVREATNVGATLPGALGLPADPQALLDHRYLWDTAGNLLLSQGKSSYTGYAYDRQDRLIIAAQTTGQLRDTPAAQDTQDTAGAKAQAGVGVDPISRILYSVTRRSPRCPIPKRPIQRNFASR